MFFYSKGAFKELLSKGSLFDRASTLERQTTGSVINLRLTGKPTILRVLSISMLSSKKRVPGDKNASFSGRHEAQ